MKLYIHRSAKKRLLERIRQLLAFPSALNEIWSIEFMSDTFINGRRLSKLNIMNDFTLESLAIVIDTSLSSLSVIKV